MWIVQYISFNANTVGKGEDRSECFIFEVLPQLISTPEVECPLFFYVAGSCINAVCIFS